MSFQLGKNITATVTYYDVMDYPLTSFEIWKHLIEYESEQAGQPSTFSDIWDILHSQQLAERITERDGLYCLKGRESLIEERIRRDKLSVRKLKRMRTLVSWLRFLPYLRMIGATGSLSMKHGERGSDWDMFVVLQAGRMFLGRTILTGFLHLIGKRRHGKWISNRACLNYFVTDDSLEIGTKDLFSAHEYRFLIPLLSFATYQRFERVNHWMKRYKPNHEATLISPRWSVPESATMKYWQVRLESLIDRFPLENWLASWQIKKIARNPKTQVEGSLIQATSQALVFLPRPRGPRVFDAFKQRLRERIPL